MEVNFQFFYHNCDCEHLTGSQYSRNALFSFRGVFIQRRGLLLVALATSDENTDKRPFFFFSV